MYKFNITVPKDEFVDGRLACNASSVENRRLYTLLVCFLDLKTQFEERLLPLCEYNYGHNSLQDSRYMTSLYIGGILLLFTNGSP